MQANLFSAMFYGSLLTIGISGTIADKFHPKWLTMFAIACNAVISFFTPLLATWNYYAYLVARFFMGVSEVRWLKKNKRRHSILGLRLSIDNVHYRAMVPAR